jgi:hypothetical protein
MQNIAIEKPSTSYSVLATSRTKGELKLQPDEQAIRVDFRLYGYCWIVKGTRGLKSRMGEWLSYTMSYPVGGAPTISL